MTSMVERVADAMEDAEVGYSIQLARLVDGVSTYQLTDSDRGPALHFGSHSSASEYIQKKNRLLRARAAIEAMREPTAWMMANASAVSVTDSVKTYESCGPLVAAINKAMIDAALEDKQ